RGSTVPLLMDARSTVPEVKAISCVGSSEQPWMSPRRHLLVFPPSAITTEEDRVLEVLLHWRPSYGPVLGRDPQVLVLPEALPSVLGADLGKDADVADIAPTTIGLASDLAGLTVSGAPITLNGQDIARDGSFLQ